MAYFKNTFFKSFRNQIVTNNHIVLILLLLFCQTGCAKEREKYVPPQPDYSHPELWYQGPVGNTAPVDLFYIYPTLGTTPTDPEGNRMYYTDVYDPKERATASSNQKYIQEVYAGTEFNLFAPCYRQMTFEHFSNGEDAYKAGMQVPLTDIFRAFDYYMARLNNGRPFILMGHSQGSILLIELIKKHLSEKELKQMVAAVLLGAQITGEELLQYPDKLQPALGEDDLGKIISINSVTDLSAKSPLLRHSAVCINPINWKTDGTVAAKEEHKGILRFDKQLNDYKLTPHFTGGYVADGYIVCTDIDPQPYFIDSFKELFPLGCLHMTETWLYSVNIRDNLRLRAKKFIHLHPIK